MSTAQTQDLQQQLRALLRTLQLPDTALRTEAPPILHHLNVQSAREILQACEAWSERGMFDESERLIHEVLLKSPETRRTFLASEVALFQQIRDTGEDQLYHGAFGLMELILPIKLRGYHVHLLRSGKFLEQPFTANALKEIAFTAGIAQTTVSAAAEALPIRSGETLATFVAQQRKLRDAITAALDAQLQLALLGNRDEATGGLASLGAMAEGAAHQFSNLLSIILGYSSLVLAKTELPEEATTALNKISEAAQNGRRLTEQILAISGANAEGEASCSVHERLTKALALLQANDPTASRLAVNLQAEHDYVLVCESTMHSVLTNLLRHAAEGASEGTMLQIVTRNSVDDGIEQIVVEVRESKGRKVLDTASSVAFPTTPEPIARAEKKVRRRLAPSAIWIADDDPAIREMCRRVLTAEGHSVEESSSGEEVQSKLIAAETPPDLLIYDFSMPDLDGVELCNWLRQHSRMTPVILISGFSAEHPDIKRILQMRKVFLLQKPFSFRDMSDLVTIAMGETLVG